jgi:hypothetical protein
VSYGAIALPLERLRRAPTRVSMAGLVEALQRLQEIRALGVSRIDLSAVPPVRVDALARIIQTGANKGAPGCV